MTREIPLYFSKAMNHSYMPSPPKTHDLPQAPKLVLEGLGGRMLVEIGNIDRL